MQKIYMGDAGPKVSPAVYGFYRWNEVKDAANVLKKIVRLCLELGINTFEHGDSYGSYQCEMLFGDLLKEGTFKREDIVLFSKCGLRVPDAQNPDIRVKHYDTSAAHITKSVESSLKKLRTDYLDIFLLDKLDPISNLEETALTLEKLKDSGKIKSIGVANFSVFQHQLLASYLTKPIVTNHIELNLLRTQALDNGQLDYIKQRYMRPLAYAPLAEGRIAAGTDQQAIKVREKLEELSVKYNANIESLAVAWLIKLGALPLIGTTNEQRIKNAANAFTIDLDHQDWYDLYNVSVAN
ncbi:MAG: aldo/keto reductase [Candidatus Pedobacter colombiensis]|uniref:Aldo/keto reductase n=1 Tax=Candidatus Pedobacter colombiensis TaxID=3121371 RepID=A0AAJ6B7Z3_9SPHI|nr:aldo/keto reductase [Pedobacter sp.]WEK20805.1 MAG: aldo/keto reductase [Pedobacter sp.]